MPLVTFQQIDQLGEIVIDNPPQNLFGGELRQSLASGPTRAHAATKRMLHAWRSGGVAAADQVTRAEGPAVMLSQDTQEGIASLKRSGPGHASFNNR
jgi:hypothetical protein